MNWSDVIEDVKLDLDKGLTLTEIGKKHGVKRQRIYQVLTKYGIQTPTRKRSNFLKDKEPKYYWLNKMLCVKKLPKEQRLEILSTLDLPDYCPILGVKLNYDGTGIEGNWSRTENSPSIDRINSSIGYTKDNIHVISWRANRIKNDSTVEELGKIYAYMLKISS